MQDNNLNSLAKTSESDLTFSDNDLQILIRNSFDCGFVIKTKVFWPKIRKRYYYYYPINKSALESSREIFKKYGIFMEQHESRRNGDNKQTVLRVNVQNITYKAESLLNKLDAVRLEFFRIKTNQMNSSKSR